MATGLSVLDELIICLSFPHIIKRNSNPSLIFFTYFCSVLYEPKSFMSFITILSFISDTLVNTFSFDFLKNNFKNNFKQRKLNKDYQKINYSVFFDASKTSWLMKSDYMQPFLIEKLVFYFLAFFILQIIAFKLCNKNLKRKLFHFLAFFIFLNLSQSVIELFQFLIFFFVLLSFTKIPRIFFRHFVNNKDYGNFIFSHIYLLAALVYTRIFLSLDQYFNLLISICVMDSFASIVGTTLQKKGKSFYGFIAGQFFSYIFEYLLKKRVDFKYHFLIGLLECFDGVNDNILLPFSTVLYYKYLN